MKWVRGLNWHGWIPLLGLLLVAAAPVCRDTTLIHSELIDQFDLAVWLEGPREGEHISVHVDLKSDGGKISGVQVDFTRSHPPMKTIDLTVPESELLAAHVRAIKSLPLCEPPARQPGETVYNLTLEGVKYEGPNVWFRNNGDELMYSADPCVAPARLSHMVWALWATRAK